VQLLLSSVHHSIHGSILAHNGFRATRLVGRDLENLVG
jgi:hypothetical protein